MLKGNIVAALTTPFLPGSGTLLGASVALPASIPASGIIYGLDEIDSASYIIQTGAGVSAGAINVQVLNLGPAASPVWLTATTPNSPTAAVFTLIATLAATTVYNGSLNVSGSVFGPVLGIRLTVSALAGGNIIGAQLNCTVR